MLKKVTWVFMSCLLLLAGQSIANNQESKTQLEVIDAYADVHSGPGRGFPVFYTIEKGEKIEVLTRRPDWYEIKTESGKIGWVTANQISRTIQTTGEPADLPSVGYGDYIKNSWVTGFSTGQFAGGDLEGYEIFSITGGYRFLSWLGADLEFGRLFGADGSGDFYGTNVYLEPAAHWKLSPYVTFGVGEISVGSQPQLVDFSEESSSYDGYGIGASFYLGRNFVVKGEYRWYSVSTDIETEDLEAWKIGFNTFF